MFICYNLFVSGKMVNLGDLFPNFKADTTIGEIEFHKWIEGSWAMLCSHPADFTPVCTTELGRMAEMVDEFKNRGVKVIALSCNDVQSHKDWIGDIQNYSNLGTCVNQFPYPIISDETRHLAVQLGMVDPQEKDKDGLPLTCRAVFIIGPDKRLKLSILYPATTGRNFTELLRVIDSLQLTSENKVATPVDWKQGEDCMVIPSVKDEELKTLFPKGVTTIPVPSGKPYLRATPNPK